MLMLPVKQKTIFTNGKTVTGHVHMFAFVRSTPRSLDFWIVILSKLL